jgi:PAS domain S-box-containing protein
MFVGWLLSRWYRSLRSNEAIGITTVMADDEHTNTGEPRRSGLSPTYWVGAEPVRDDTPVMGGPEPAVERRRRPRPSTPLGYLHQLPAVVLLDRLAAPMLAVRLDGVLTYTNPAFAKMLGHADTATLIGQSLPTLLAGHTETAPQDCVAALRTAGIAVTAWCHAEGFLIHTVTSEPLLAATDPVLLISVTDISELMWNTALSRTRQQHP